MKMLYELPEQRPMKGKRTYTVLLIVLLDSILLVLALILFFPLLTGSTNRHLTSSDWSGYVVASDLSRPQPQVTRIDASWIVPTVNVSRGNSYSAAWIGVGGQFDGTLIQAGTEQDSVNGLRTYYAWYELLPRGAVTIDSLSVAPGDRITASISLLDPNTNKWSIEIHDVTNGQSFQKNPLYDSSMLSAEWIVERPTVNNRLESLADFGEITFTGCTAVISGKGGTVNGFPSIQVTMDNRQNVELASASPFSSQDSSFTVDYLG
jgi:hypothetical protein